MTYIIAEPCLETKDSSCVEVCPVDCIYEADDQFNVYADGQGSNSLTPTTMSNFEVHAASKMNALTGAPGAGFNDDIVTITYLNAAAGGGVSVFSLGS